MRYKKTLIFSFMILALILGLFAVSPVKGAFADISYTFNDDVMFNSTGLGQQRWYDNSSNTFNVRERQEITGHFNATYSFENEVDGTSDNDITGLTTFSTDDTNGAVVVAGLDVGHSKIINISGNGDFGKTTEILTDSVAQISGTFEFWGKYIDNGQGRGRFRFYDQAFNTMLYGEFDAINNRLEIYHGDGLGGSTQVNTLLATDTWAHIKFEFNCATDKMDVWINGINIINNENFYNDLTSISFRTIKFIVDDGGGNNALEFAYDAIGYSWDTSYNIGNNLVPYIQNYSLLENQYEVDKWEFRHNPDTRTQYLDGTDDPSGWSDYGDAEPAIDDVNTLSVGGNRTVVVHVQENGGLNRNFNGINDTFYNITFNFQINDFDDTDIGVNAIVMNIRDSDDITFLTYLHLSYDGDITLSYSGGNHLIGTFDPISSYSVSFFLNMRSQIQNFTMRYYDNQSLVSSFTAPFNADGNDIDRVHYEHTATTNEVDSYLMSISIYDTISSISDDIGQLLWNEIAVEKLGVFDFWDYTEFNLLNIYGNFENITIFYESFGGIVLDIYMPWTSIIEHNIANIYDLAETPNTFQSELTAWINGNFSFNSIIVHGVKLNEGLNSYPLIFSHGNIEVNESYFYVDVDNKLQFIHIADDIDIEYIQAEFNIVDVPSQDFAIKYVSDINNMAFGFFRVNFTDISNFFPILPYDTITRSFITQGKTVSSLIILITDDDLLNNGTTVGFVSDIELLFVVGVRVSVTTSNLLNIIIPLIIIFIPTFLLSARLNENMIVPIMMLMSLVCVATGIIPLWLFFIIIIPSSLFLFLKRSEVLE